MDAFYFSASTVEYLPFFLLCSFLQNPISATLLRNICYQIQGMTEIQSSKLGIHRGLKPRAYNY